MREPREIEVDGDRYRLNGNRVEVNVGGWRDLSLYSFGRASAIRYASAVREVARLQEENAALRDEITVLRAEIDEHRDAAATAEFGR